MNNNELKTYIVNYAVEVEVEAKTTEDAADIVCADKKISVVEITEIRLKSNE